MSLPWVEEHPDVFNDAAFTVTAADSFDFTPPTSPLTVVPVTSRENRDERQCAAGKMHVCHKYRIICVVLNAREESSQVNVFT